MSVTAELLLERIFPPDGQTISLGIARNWPAVELAVKQLAAAMNGEQNVLPSGQARTPEWYTERNARIYRIMAENPGMPGREVARLAGVSIGVINNLSKKRLRTETDMPDHIVESDEMVERGNATPEPVRTGPETTQESQEVEKTTGCTHQEVKPEQIESSTEPTKNQYTAKKVHDLTPSEAGKIKGPRIPHTEDDWIVDEKIGGKTFREIHEALQARGITCTMNDVMARFYDAKRKREQAAAGKKSPQTPTPSELGQQKKDESRASGPESKSISRAELDQKIWAAWKAGKTPKDISDELCSEGYYYGEQRVRRMLLQQGADL
jgi:hypothetical protein